MTSRSMEHKPTPRRWSGSPADPRLLVAWCQVDFLLRGEALSYPHDSRKTDAEAHLAERWATALAKPGSLWASAFVDWLALHTALPGLSDETRGIARSIDFATPKSPDELRAFLRAGAAVTTDDLHVTESGPVPVIWPIALHTSKSGTAESQATDQCRLKCSNLAIRAATAMCLDLLRHLRATARQLDQSAPLPRRT